MLEKQHLFEPEENYNHGRHKHLITTVLQTGLAVFSKRVLKKR